MGSKVRQPRATLAGRLVRGRRFDRNPLRRPADRAETIMLALLLVAFLIAAPLAALVSGAWTHAIAHWAEVAQTASRRQVAAVVLTAAGAPTGGSWNLDSVSRARWTAPDGTVVTREVPVPADTIAGATVRVWTTRDGQLSAPPITESEVASLADLGGMAGAGTVAVLLALIGVLSRRSLDKRRMAAWEADWESTEPRWTTRA
jgi:hypothetical protein